MIILIVFLFSGKAYSTNIVDEMQASVSIKVPGNKSVNHSLTVKSRQNNPTVFDMISDDYIPISIQGQVSSNNNKGRIKISITAKEETYFNLTHRINTGFKHSDCQFVMPGFWYRRNLLSPKEAPSFHTSDSWIVREDRLSIPMTGAFNEKTGDYLTVIRIDEFRYDALTTHKEGEVVVSGKTSLGFTGFENFNNETAVSFGFPYIEAPKSYIRKLTLAPSVVAFQKINKGETIHLEWEVTSNKAVDYSDFIKQIWEYGFDTYKPQLVAEEYDKVYVKDVLSSYFTESFNQKYDLKFMTGAHLRIADCDINSVAEVGFVGRVLLNAYNSLEYGEANNRDELVRNSKETFDSYLKHGFTQNGFFREFVNLDSGKETDIFSIRRQSEGIYAILHYLQYEKDKGRNHAEWESRLKRILENILNLQNSDGSFPRKFKDGLDIVDATGGSTPSATLTLIMAYKYFNDKRYLECAKRTANYLEKELIEKANYFSSTLDANCEDKEASLYASTAMYYLALISKGDDRRHYADMSRKSAYFTLSWYYVWDVPFAQGQMLGDIGLKTRGWGNVSVENNHIDVFIFEFASVLDWLSKEFEEPRFSSFANLIRSSMTQLLPYEGHLCGIAKKGYYPEVVQHTNWDYGKNGKGFYNDIFAPGWVVASLWELLTPGRAEKFLQKGN